MRGGRRRIAVITSVVVVTSVADDSDGNQLGSGGSTGMPGEGRSGGSSMILIGVSSGIGGFGLGIGVGIGSGVGRGSGAGTVMVVFAWL